MSRFLINLVGITLWAFITLLLLTNCAFPDLPLGVASVNLGFSLILAAWVVFVATETASRQLFRASQAIYLSVPLGWALWTAGTHDLSLVGSAWFYLVSVSVLSGGVLEIARLEQNEEVDSVRVELLEAVRPILSAPTALDTGSMRIPR